ncbi:hypothetical protein lbkm_0497 [Lachnospiraceae bacterium KM106-2]|nr:hypothetical protein lbkm_0497 [Lachnospiraceae bacterium KM106-2]
MKEVKEVSKIEQIELCKIDQSKGSDPSSIFAIFIWRIRTAGQDS